MKYSIERGVGINGLPWERTDYTPGKFHPEDEFRTTEEILKDCEELEADIARLKKELS